VLLNKFLHVVSYVHFDLKAAVSTYRKKQPANSNGR